MSAHYGCSHYTNSHRSSSHFGSNSEVPPVVVENTINGGGGQSFYEEMEDMFKIERQDKVKRPKYDDNDIFQAAALLALYLEEE